MRVLLTGTEASGMDRVERRLRAAGHEAVSCVDDGPARSHRCAGAEDPQRCPATGGVDVILAVRERPLPHLTSRERLAECALLQGVPLVVAGSVVLNPFGDRAATLVPDLDDAVDACAVVVARQGRPRSVG